MSSQKVVVASVLALILGSLAWLLLTRTQQKTEGSSASQQLADDDERVGLDPTHRKASPRVNKPVKRPAKTKQTSSVQEHPLEEMPAYKGEEETFAGESVWPINAEGIQGAMREAIPDIKACYDIELAKNPELGGKLVLDFTIDSPDTAEGMGMVIAVGLQETSFSAPELESCVLDHVESLQFDAPSEEVTVSYPFNFSPK